MNWKKNHRNVALVVTLPLLMITLTGILLQLRNQFEWIQPVSLINKLELNVPLISIEKAMTGLNPAEVEQVIYRPSKGSLAIRLKDGVELQVHPQTGLILKKAVRRTNFLIELHQGSWFGQIGQYFIYLLTGIGLCFLIISGLKICTFSRRRL